MSVAKIEVVVIHVGSDFSLPGVLLIVPDLEQDPNLIKSLWNMVPLTLEVSM